MDKRSITGWIFLFVILAAVYFGGWAFGAFLLILLIFGMSELLKMLHSKNLYPSVTTCYLSSFLFMFLGCIGKIQFLHLATIVLIICAFLTILKRGKSARIKDIGATLLCMVYGGILPSHFLFLRNMDAGTINLLGIDNFSLALGYVIMLVVCITATDVGAYFIGCKFGKHKLWEAVSPKKTIEGSAAGAIFAILFALGIGSALEMAWWQSLLAGITITLFAQLGDLVESMMKRDASVKDASDILPGHGGFLDRADSYIFTVAIAYYFFYYIVVHPVF